MYLCLPREPTFAYYLLLLFVSIWIGVALEYRTVLLFVNPFGWRVVMMSWPLL